MSDQGWGSTGTAPMDPVSDDGVPPRHFERPIPDDELAACARPPAWDESGFPVASQAPSLPARVWRLLEG